MFYVVSVKAHNHRLQWILAVTRDTELGRLGKKYGSRNEEILALPPCVLFRTDICSIVLSRSRCELFR